MNPISLHSTTLPAPVYDRTAGSKTDTPDEAAFNQMLDKSIGRVNQLQNEANEAIVDLTTGNRDDIHQTMIAMEKASIAFELMMQVRNKVITAYETVMRMSV